MVSRCFSWLLFVIRALMGAYFLQEAEHQLASGWIGGDGLSEKLRKGLDTAVPPYDELIRHVFLHIDGPLTVLVILGEIAVGAALVLGLFTRLTAAVAVLMNVNFFLMNGLHADSGGIDVAFITGEALLFAFAAHQALSLDSFLARRGISGPLMSGNHVAARARA